MAWGPVQLRREASELSLAFVPHRTYAKRHIRAKTICVPKINKNISGGQMASTVTVATTGNSYIDGLLFGTKWASASLTYSFPTSPSYYSTYTSSEPQTNFKAFTSVQQLAVAKV